MEHNIDGDASKFSGELVFPPLETAEIDALHQIEGAALALARRAVIEQKAMQKQIEGSAVLPFIFGGFGQGGSLALFTAICLMPTPIMSVLFSHSGLPVGGMLGKRLSDPARCHTKLHAVYDKADKEVPSSYPEAIRQMFGLLRCSITLDWLYNGDGHDFFDEAVAKATHRFREDLQGVVTPAPEARDQDNKMNQVVDAARAVLQQAGGPPKPKPPEKKVYPPGFINWPKPNYAED